MVILRLREERARDWCAHEQVHVELVRDLRVVLSAVSRAVRIACVGARVQGVLGDMLGRAHVEVEPRDVGYGKDRSAADLRKHMKESLVGIVEGRRRANDDLLAERLEEVKRLEEEEYVLVSTGGDRATLRDVRKRLRNARNAITVLRKGDPTLEKRLADPGLYRDVVLVPADKLALRVAKFDVVLREDALQSTRAMHAVLSRMVMFRCTCQ